MINVWKPRTLIVTQGDNCIVYLSHKFDNRSLIDSEKNVVNFLSDPPLILETRFTKISHRILFLYARNDVRRPCTAGKKKNPASSSPVDVTLINALFLARVTARNRE